MPASVSGPDDPVNLPEGAEWQLRQAICAWFEGPLGFSLQAMEAHRLRSILPHLYGQVALQLGYIGKMDLLDASIASTRVILEPRLDLKRASVVGIPEALPLDNRSVDLVLLPHTLDFSPEPHQVLRETCRVLVPEGHVIIFGFNPVSLWGLWRLFNKRSGAVPWCGNFVRLFRVKDWLKLLDFEVTQGSMLYYRPPIAHERTRERLHFMEQAGDRWWPLAAAVYFVVAKKRVPGMTPLQPSWRQRRMLGRRVTQPMAKSG